MARYKDGTRVATTLFEAAAWHYAIKPVCRCGHSATFNAHCLWWRFARREVEDNLAAMQRRFWCRECSQRVGRRVRPARVEIVPESEDDITGTWPPENEWKRAVSRFRS